MLNLHRQTDRQTELGFIKIKTAEIEVRGMKMPNVQRLARSRNTAQKVVLRAKIVLKKMEGLKFE